MNTYRVKDGIDRDVQNIGRTVNGRIITTAKIVHPLFELVEEPQANTANIMTAAPTGQAMISTSPTTTPQDTMVDAAAAPSLTPQSSQPVDKETKE